MDNGTNKSIANELALTFINFKKLGLKKRSESGLRQSEFILLTVLAQLDKENSGAVKTTDLSSHMQITPAAVTHIVKVLVKKKLVQRLTDPSDRRLVLIKPSQEGMELVNTVKNRVLKKCEELTELLGQKDSRELVRLLTLTLDFFLNRQDEK